MKRAIIFGATGGIGRAIAENMAENGWSLYIHYNHNQQEAGKMVQEFIENYPDQEFFSLKNWQSLRCLGRVHFIIIVKSPLIIKNFLYHYSRL